MWNPTVHPCGREPHTPKYDQYELSFDQSHLFNFILSFFFVNNTTHNSESVWIMAKKMYVFCPAQQFILDLTSSSWQNNRTVGVQTFHHSKIIFCFYLTVENIERQATKLCGMWFKDSIMSTFRTSCLCSLTSSAWYCAVKPKTSKKALSCMWLFCQQKDKEWTFKLNTWWYMVVQVLKVLRIVD